MTGVPLQTWQLSGAFQLSWTREGLPVEWHRSVASHVPPIGVKLPPSHLVCAFGEDLLLHPQPVQSSEVSASSPPMISPSKPCIMIVLHTASDNNICLFNGTNVHTWRHVDCQLNQTGSDQTREISKTPVHVISTSKYQR